MVPGVITPCESAHSARSNPASAWARACYDQHRQGGKTHYSAARILANRWLRILHHLLATSQRYDEAVHERNRDHASADSAA